MSDIVLILLFLAGVILGIIIFVYSIIFLISVPKSLKKISKAANRIACALEHTAYNDEDEGDDW